jgi:hypothetical protein
MPGGDHGHFERSPEAKAFFEEQRRKREEERRLAEPKLREREELEARWSWQRFHEGKAISDIEQMSGREFEQFLARLLSRMDYTQILLTPNSNDQGGDIVCNCPQGIRTVVQAKRWKNKLGNSVVQEVLGAMLIYGCQTGMIVTNSSFTRSARSLASKDPRIVLCDGSWLQKRVEEYLPPEVPAFDREEYEKSVKGKVSLLFLQSLSGTRRSAPQPRKSLGLRFGKRKWRLP